MVDAELAMLTELSAALREHDRLKSAMQWISSIETQCQNVSAFSKAVCVDVLTQLEQHPKTLRAIELEKVVKMRTIVERRLDEIDLSDLIARVAAMSKSVRRRLFEQLDSLDPR